jgi:hypothetical protein
MRLHKFLIKNYVGFAPADPLDADVVGLRGSRGPNNLLWVRPNQVRNLPTEKKQVNSKKYRN